jgi:hypothetical protein
MVSRSPSLTWTSSRTSSECGRRCSITQIDGAPGRRASARALAPRRARAPSTVRCTRQAKRQHRADDRRDDPHAIRDAPANLPQGHHGRRFMAQAANALCLTGDLAVSRLGYGSPKVAVPMRRSRTAIPPIAANSPRLPAERWKLHAVNLRQPPIARND